MAYCLEVVGYWVVGWITRLAATYIVAGRRLVRTLHRRLSHLFALTYDPSLKQQDPSSPLGYCFFLLLRI